MVARVEEMAGVIQVGERIEEEQLTVLPLSWRRDQGIGEVGVLKEEVWEAVDTELAACCVTSPTMALSDAYEAMSDDLTRMLEAIRLPHDCAGVAVGAGGRMVGLEILGCASLWRRHQARILRSFGLDALRARKPKRRPRRETAERLIRHLKDLPDTTVPSPGLGTQHRMRGRHLTASALEVEGRIYHLSVIA